MKVPHDLFERLLVRCTRGSMKLSLQTHNKVYICPRRHQVQKPVDHAHVLHLVTALIDIQCHCG
jgi:hypothetical protein